MEVTFHGEVGVKVRCKHLTFIKLLKNIAFVDEHGDNFQVGYTLEDEVNILKNDPRIKKVYTTPGHPHPNPGKPAPITRLAKLV